jgi:acyl dehydratase
MSPRGAPILINYDEIMQLKSIGDEFRYTDRETMLYALGVGFDARFSAPVFPGETIVTEFWVDGCVVSFRCKLKEREAVVLNNGKCTLAA